MTDDPVEELEERLAALARDGGLAGEAESHYQRMRGRVSARHRQWRDGVPALDMLFDEDEHRAKALAGNLTTEYEETVQAWVRCSGATPDIEHPWIRAYRVAWRELASAYGRTREWQAEAHDVFELFLDELSERAHGRIVQGTVARPIGRGPNSRWRALMRAPILWIRRVFLPSVDV